MDGADFIAPRPAEQIRFMTAGNVDDGKSTLIGRLLLDAGALMRDQIDTLGDDFDDLARLTDGLEAERAQGITIDVAYRYFATPRASFIIADAPGHEQYTRNMVTAASTADVAVVVIDAARVESGVLRPQTRRHSAIAALMGLDLIVAVNKMDLVGWSQARFAEIETAFAALAESLGLARVVCVPIAARTGENVVRRGGADWWAGPPLIDVISRSRAGADRNAGPLRLPVQTVLRAGVDRFYAGRIESGVLRVGDTVSIGAAATAATIAQVQIGGRAVDEARTGASVAVRLAEERDITRGDVIAAPGACYTRTLTADMCWLDENAWERGRRYVLRQGALETHALIEAVNYVHDIADLTRRPKGDALTLNDIASVQIATRDPILADLYAGLPATGAFALFDPRTNQTCAAGMIRETSA